MSVENLKIKSAIVDEIKGKLENAQSVVVVDYLGTTVEQATAMRSKLRDANVDFTVYKNTLISRAVEGTPFEGLRDVLAGPSALAICHEDAIAPARVIAGAIKGDIDVRGPVILDSAAIVMGNIKSMSVYDQTLSFLLLYSRIVHHRQA